MISDTGTGSFQEEIQIVTPKLTALSKMMLLYDIPGVSLAIVQGQTIKTVELGVKNSLSGETVTSKTVFEAASLTKPLIAYLALQLCEMGVLELDQPLPSLDENLPSITLRQILSHTGGFPSVNRKMGDPLRLVSPPGSSFAYSGEGYTYLGGVIEHLTKTPLNSLMEKFVFTPLQMEDSSLIWEERYATQTASPHNRAGQPTEKWKPSQAIASFSLHTTASDFAKFVLASQKITLMLEICVPINSEIGWGLGWGIESTAQGKAFWHSGDNGTFQSFAFFNQTFGLVLMTNSANGFQIVSEVLHLLAPGHHPLIEWERLDIQDEIDEEFLANWWKIYGI